MFIWDNIQHFTKEVLVIHFSPSSYTSLFFFHLQPSIFSTFTSPFSYVSLLPLLRSFPYYFSPKHRANCIICQIQCRMKMWTLVHNSENRLLLLSLFLSSPVIEFPYLLWNNALPIGRASAAPQRLTGTLSTPLSGTWATSQNHSLSHPSQQVDRSRGMGNCKPVLWRKEKSEK